MKSNFRTKPKFKRRKAPMQEAQSLENPGPWSIFTIRCHAYRHIFLKWIYQTIRSFKAQLSDGLRMPVTIESSEVLEILGGFAALSDVFRSTKMDKFRPWVRSYSHVWTEDCFFTVMCEQFYSGSNSSISMSPDYAARLLDFLDKGRIMLTASEEKYQEWVQKAGAFAQQGKASALEKKASADVFKLNAAPEPFMPSSVPRDVREKELITYSDVEATYFNSTGQLSPYIPFRVVLPEEETAKQTGPGNPTSAEEEEHKSKGANLETAETSPETRIKFIKAGQPWWPEAPLTHDAATFPAISQGSASKLNGDDVDIHESSSQVSANEWSTLDSESESDVEFMPTSQEEWVKLYHAKNAELNSKSEEVDILRAQLQAKSQETDNVAAELRTKSEEAERVAEQVRIKSEELSAKSKKLNEVKTELPIKSEEIAKLTEKLELTEMKMSRERVESMDAQEKLKKKLKAAAKTQLEENNIEWGMARENLALAEAKVAALEEEKGGLEERLKVLETQIEGLRTENTHLLAFRPSQRAEAHERGIRNQLTEEVKQLKARIEILEEERTVDLDAIRKMAGEQHRQKEKITDLENENADRKRRVADLERQLAKRGRGTGSRS